MYKFILIVFLLFALIVKAESQDNTDTTRIIQSWTLINDFTTKQEIAIDSILTDFQIYNPIYQKSVSNSFLGNVGSPAMNNVYDFSEYKHEVFLIQPLIEYMYRSEKTDYVNTKKPFTKLTYINGGSNRDKMEILDVYHTQNITKNFNSGVKYKLSNSKGQYAYQSTRISSFKFLTSFESVKYKAFSNVNINKINIDENGGVTHDFWITDSTARFNNTIPTNLTGDEIPKANTKSEIRNLDFLLVQNVNLFTGIGKNDTSKTKKDFKLIEPVITYTLRYYRVKRDFIESDSVSYYFPKTYINPSLTHDSLYYDKISNSLRIELSNNYKSTKRIFFGAYNEYVTIKNNTPRDTSFIFNSNDTTDKRNSLFSYYTYENGDTLFSINRRKYISNTFVNGGIYGKFWNTFEAAFDGELCILGYKLGNLNLNGKIENVFKISDDDLRIAVHARITNEKPDYLLNSYYSNHDIWNENFNYQQSSNLSSIIYSLSNKYEIKFNYSLIRNRIYFKEQVVNGDTVILPDQYNDNLSIMSLHLSKNFKFWKFFSLNKLIYQYVDNDNIIGLPEFIYYNSTYFDHIFNFKSTGGKIQIAVGFDLYYNTAYYGYNYNPSITTFYKYSKNQKKLGHYPYIDVFANVRLKRARAFFKIENVNAGLLNSNYFTALHYPRQAFMFVYGVSWIFYD